MRIFDTCAFSSITFNVECYILCYMVYISFHTVSLNAPCKLYSTSIKSREHDEILVIGALLYIILTVKDIHVMVYTHYSQGHIQ